MKTEFKPTKEDLKEIMINFPTYNGGPWEILDECIKAQKKLYEGLIKSYPLHALIQKIKRDIPDSITEVKKSNGTYELTVYLNYDTYNETMGIFTNILLVYGWKISLPINLNKLHYQEINDETYIKFIVHAVFDVNDSQTIYHANGNKKPTKLYHITPEVNLRKIMISGLTPKSNSKMEYHSERIYFITDISDKNKIKDLISQLFIKNGNDIEYKLRYVVLEIDLNKARQEVDPQFFKDPNLDGAVYTMENIHPNAIKPIEVAEITFQDEDNYHFTIDIQPINESITKEINEIIKFNESRILR